MFLKSFSYSLTPEDGEGWKIDNCELNNINLIAGKNASGKTRLLEAIDDFSTLLDDDKVNLIDNITFNWKMNFQDNDKKIIYEFKYLNGTILKEELKINKEIFLQRDENGKGFIKNEAVNQKFEIEVEKNKIVIVSKRDKKQHPFLEKLFDWSDSVVKYNFGDKLGKETVYSIKVNKSTNKTILEKNKLIKLNKNSDSVIAKFHIGESEFKDKFVNRVIEDFNNIGYSLEEIGITNIPNYILSKLQNISSVPSILYIKEENIKDTILQHEISQGMFRALSLIIQITYLEFNLTINPVCVLIDDIGEGLDFERSNKLIKYLVQKTEKLEGKLQLVMSTNDRFVMNSVALKYWTIIDKIDGKMNFYTQKSHSEVFEDFEDIGLNNFDFFSGEYFKQNFDDN